MFLGPKGQRCQWGGACPRGGSDDAPAHDDGLWLPLRARVGVFAMHVGVPDDEGEYPVVDVRPAEQVGGVEIEVTHTGFDVFLAWVGRAVEDPERVHAKALREARERDPSFTEEVLLARSAEVRPGGGSPRRGRASPHPA